MSYVSLDAERRKAVLEATERVAAAAPAELDDLAAAAAREVRRLTGASRARLELVQGAGSRSAEGFADAVESISVPVEIDGSQVALLTVARDDSEEDFSEADVEALLMFGRCVSTLLRATDPHAEAS
jgi:hypothetical protein